MPVEATIANGKITKIDTAAAEKMPGVRAIFHRANIGKIFRSTPGEGLRRNLCRATSAVRGRCHSLLRPIRCARGGGYFRSGQSRGGCGSWSPMRRKSRTSKPTSRPTKIRTRSRRPYGPVERLQSERGDPETAFASAPVKLDQTYVTPAETHNPIELQGATAIWDGDKIDDLRRIAVDFQHARRDRADVRFAERECARNHEVRWLGFREQALAVDALSAGRAAARQLGRPVKLVLSRQDDIPDQPVIARAPSNGCGSAPRRMANSYRSSTITFTKASMLDGIPRGLRRSDARSTTACRIFG